MKVQGMPGTIILVNLVTSCHKLRLSRYPTPLLALAIARNQSDDAAAPSGWG